MSLPQVSKLALGRAAQANLTERRAQGGDEATQRGICRKLLVFDSPAKQTGFNRRLKGPRRHRRERSKTFRELGHESAG